MNKKTKIISFFLILIVVAIIGAKIYVKSEMENIDWNKLNEKFQEQEKHRNDSINLIKPNRNQQSVINSKDYKSVNKLYVPFNDDWFIQADVNEQEVDFYYLVLGCKKDESLVSIMSQKPHQYIEGLENLAKYYNEKIVRNLDASGIQLRSKFNFKDIFKNVEANYEFYESTFKETGEKNTCIAVNMIYQEYIYTIFFLETEQSQKIIEGITLKKIK